MPHYWVVSRLTRGVVYLRPVVHFFPAYSLQARLSVSAAAYILKNYGDVTSRAAARVAGVVAQFGAQPETAKVKEETPTSSGEATSPPNSGRKSYAIDEVVKHNRNDIWVIVDGQVLYMTKFLPDHLGGKKAILLFDATEMFNMLHKP
ncbi:hypothetical protein EDB83DRAFT_2516248 [Lactarius deliciosus]|nr:hypothetical protein EDB83DRAFT_2516248 [Lactarius deliciosus]